MGSRVRLDTCNFRTGDVSDLLTARWYRRDKDLENPQVMKYACRHYTMLMC